MRYDSVEQSFATDDWEVLSALYLAVGIAKDCHTQGPDAHTTIVD